MTTTLAPPAPVAPPQRDRSRAARRAITRWAWRLLRREWRQQLLVLVLIVVAVAATTVGLGIVVNVQAADPLLGAANTRIDIGVPGSGVAADLAAARDRFGTVEAIEHENVPVPGSVTPVDLRAQDPHGPYGAPLLRLVAGSYPSGPAQVAMTSTVAAMFNVKIGADWTVAHRVLRVVGIVENPRDLADRFALVAPGQLPAPSGLSLLTGAAGSAANGFHPPAGNLRGIIANGSTAAEQRRTQALAMLLLSTIGLIFIGLLAAAGFTVMAHRRQRALGMIAAIGATDRQVRRVLLANGAATGIAGAGGGVVVGLAVWFGCRAAFEHLMGHRIDSLAIPWWAVLASAVLAILMALAASWWPARTAARLPIVAALSGRPAPPRPAHRFALLGVVLAALGVVSLVVANHVHPVLIVTGIVATAGGVLLLAPVGIRIVAASVGRAPVAMRLAARDLARYQARSGAALAAASLAIGIAATIAITAAAEQAADHTLSGGNLPPNQLIAWVKGNPNDQGGPGGGIAIAVPGQSAPSAPSPAVIAGARHTAESIAQALGTRHIVELDIAGNSNGDAPQNEQQASLVRPIVYNGQHGWNFITTPYVATPALLAFYGIPASAVGQAGVLSARTDLTGIQVTPADERNYQGVTVQVSNRLPDYTSAPNTLITPSEAHALGFTPQPVGWLVQTAHALTSAQITTARHRAAIGGIAIETRTAGDDSQQRLRDDATIIGALIALGVLAMTVGLIRSETANDLRTLAATGASARTRRTLTAATAAALALLGGTLGTVGAYLALIAWHWRKLDYLSSPPYLDLAALVIGLPIVAFIGGWLFGRTPASIARRPLD